MHKKFNLPVTTNNSTRPSVGDNLAIVDPPSTKTSATWWLYLLACKDGRTYAGITLDIKARFLSHTRGKGAKFTRANPPLAVLGAQAFTSKGEALQAEYALKQLNKFEKLQWARRWPYSGNATQSLG